MSVPSETVSRETIVVSVPVRGHRDGRWQQRGTLTTIVRSCAERRSWPLGGDKAEDSEWNDRYVTAVPVADALYENHLDGTGRTDEETN